VQTNRENTFEFDPYTLFDAAAKLPIPAVRGSFW
jgi:hypothetical protein